MAKIKFGSVITDSRGHIGGITYKWGRFGNVAQRLVTPTLHRTARSSSSRARFASLSRRWWSVLTPTERTDWRSLAAANPRPNTWGDDFPLSGLALFIGINSTLDQAGFTMIDTAPSDQTVTALSTMTFAATAPNSLVVTFTPSPLPTDHLLYISARPNFSPGISNSARLSSFLVASAIEITSTLNIGTQFAARFGPIIATRQQYIEARLLNTVNGAVSAAIVGSEIAT